VVYMLFVTKQNTVPTTIEIGHRNHYEKGKVEGRRAFFTLPCIEYVKSCLFFFRFDAPLGSPRI
jgi:hypothetical protein